MDKITLQLYAIKNNHSHTYTPCTFLHTVHTIHTSLFVSHNHIQNTLTITHSSKYEIIYTITHTTIHKNKNKSVTTVNRLFQF